MKKNRFSKFKKSLLELHSIQTISQKSKSETNKERKKPYKPKTLYKK
jgi:hypothetical protein